MLVLMLIVVLNMCTDREEIERLSIGEEQAPTLLRIRVNLMPSPVLNR